MGYDESSLSFYFFVGTICAALIWELFWPRRPESKGLATRWANNVAIALINQLVLRGTFAASLIMLAWLAQNLGLGLLHDTDLPWIVIFLVAALVMDFAGYLLHIAMHKVPWLWRCHMIHHCDTSLDWTSSHRHHPLEAAITAVVAVPVIALLGPPVSVMVAYQTLRLVLVIWGHVNTYIPEPVDRFLRLFVVTPDFHRLHHCSEQRFTDSNYGGISPWFDYLFRTASDRPFAEHRTMEIGLENFRELSDSRLDRLLLMPFRSPNPGRDSPAESGEDKDPHCADDSKPVDLQPIRHPS